MSSLLQRIRRRITSAMLESQVRMFERAAAEGHLSITRRAGVRDDAVSAERFTPITYELAITSGAKQTVVAQLTWNPDPGETVEPALMAQQPGLVRDALLRAAILQGTLKETRRGARGEDPDVEHTVALDGRGHFQTGWRAKPTAPR